MCLKKIRLLNETKGSLLDNVELVDTLEVSKQTSKEVTESVIIAEQNEIKIDAAREVTQTFDFKKMNYSLTKNLKK